MGYYYENRYVSKTLKGAVLIWLLKDRRGDLTQLYSENTRIKTLAYGLRCIIDNYGAAALQKISDEEVKFIAKDIKKLCSGPSWERLNNINFY